MDDTLLIMTLFAVSGIIGVLLAWAINSFIFTCVLRQPGLATRKPMVSGSVAVYSSDDA